MAEVAKRGTVSPVSGNISILNGPSIITLSPDPENILPPLIAGEPLKPGDACFIWPTDGRVYQCWGLGTGYTGGATAAAVGTTAQVDGFCAEQVFAAGEPVTLYVDLVWDYAATAVACGTRLYVSGTVLGGLADTATAGGTAWVGKIMGESPAAATTTKALLTRSRY